MGLAVYSTLIHLPAALVTRGVYGVEILAVEIVLRDAEGIGESLIVNYLALAQIFERLSNVWIVNQAQKIIVGHTRLLLC